MPLLSHPAFGPRAALAYITVGSLIDIWVGVWYFFFVRGTEATSVTYFWLIGLFLTGLTLLVIGLMLGRIGQAARRAELPPPEAVAAEAAVQKTASAAQNAPPAVLTPTAPVAPIAPAAPVAPAAPAGYIPSPAR